MTARIKVGQSSSTANPPKGSSSAALSVFVRYDWTEIRSYTLVDKDGSIMDVISAVVDVAVAVVVLEAVDSLSIMVPLDSKANLPHVTIPITSSTS